MTPMQLERIRGKEIAMVHQDPMTSLNPSFRIGMQLTEVLDPDEGLGERRAHGRSPRCSHKVNLPDPEVVMRRYPHQLSGGQQQRVMIAMALLCRPALMVMDEPTTALDVTVEAAILDHVRSLRSEFDSAILYITHNLGVVARFCDRVAVMYAGELVEAAPSMNLRRAVASILRGLISCVPKISACKETERLNSIEGQVPPAYIRPPGCIFEPRCPFSAEMCRAATPTSSNTLESGRSVRCFRWQDLADCGCLTAEPASAAEPFVRKAGADAEPGCTPADGALLNVSNLKTYFGQRVVLHVPTPYRERSRPWTTSASRWTGTGSSAWWARAAAARARWREPSPGWWCPTRVSIEFLGVDVTKVVEQRERGVVRELQMVFQNPDSSLNPTKTDRQIITRPLQQAGNVPRRRYP